MGTIIAVLVVAWAGFVGTIIGCFIGSLYTGNRY